MPQVFFPQQQRGQQGHHRDQTNQHATAGDDAHLLDATEIRQAHGKEGSCGGEAASEDTLSGVDHRSADGGERRFALLEFFLKAADEMDTKVDGQADEHGRKGDGQDVEMAHRQGGVPHRVAQPNEQRNDGLLRASPMIVAD